MKNNHEYTVYKDGSRAKTIIGNINVITIGFLVTFGKIQYHIGYFQDGKRYTEWVETCELKFDDNAQETTIGFKNAK